jgi:hypothetical protein
VKEKTVVTTYQEFKQIFDDLKGGYYFRGHADRSWELAPSLFRDGAYDEKTEIKTINEYNERSESPLHKLFHMQHYTQKTRILDLTISWNVALFFACCEHSDRDGEIIVFNKDCALDIMKFEAFNKKYRKEQLNEAELEFINKNHIVSYGYNFSNNRALLQGGVALIFGFDKSKRNVAEMITKKVIVPASEKAHLLLELQKMGIDKNTLYDMKENIKSESVSLKEIHHKQDEPHKFMTYYRLNTLFPKRDQLEACISNIHTDILIKYPCVELIWMYVYYDDYDAKINPETGCNESPYSNYMYIVSTDQKKPNIVWNECYFWRRLKIINEEVTPKIAYEKVLNCFRKIELIYLEIKESGDNFLTVIKKNVNNIIKIWSGEAQVIPFTDGENDGKIQDVLSFIDQVSCFKDCIDYEKRGEKIKTIKYRFDEMYRSCDAKYRLAKDAIASMKIQE